MKTNVSNPVVENNLTAFTIQDWCAANSIVSRHAFVRVNVNGYPYVTLIDVDNKAENVYFSKALVEAEPEKFVLGATVDRALMQDLQIVEYTNEAGELRVKFARPNGNRLDMDDLF